MLKTLENGLKLWNETDGTTFLAIDSSRLDDCVNYVRQSGIKNVAINSSWGFESDNIDFLQRLTDILEGLHLQETNVGYSVINGLSKIKHLRYSDNEIDAVDIANFPHLQSLRTDYTPRLRNIADASSLKTLYLTNFKPKTKDVTELVTLRQLTSLGLMVTNIDSFNGVQGLVCLKELQIYRAPNLKDVGKLAELGKLEEIEFESCKAIENYQQFSKIKGLKELKLFRCGDIQSLSFIKALEHLEFLSLYQTNVLDGDLEWLELMEGAPYVSFDNKKHYNRKMGDFKVANERHIPKWKKEQEKLKRAP